MKRKYKQWMASLFCLSLMALGACGGGGNDRKEFDEDYQLSDTREDDGFDGGGEDSGSLGDGECTDEEWAQCNIWAGDYCIAGTCIRGGGGGDSGGGNECNYAGGCPSGTYCSNGICM